MKIQQLAEKAYELRKKLFIEGYKTVIEKTFSITKNDLCFENIQLRLTVIDSLFSTNILKNHGALDQLSHVIYELTQSNDENMIAIATEYLNSKPSENTKGAILFDTQFGTKEKRAKSLISKYCYFLTGSQFPIYDKFVRKLITKLAGNSDPSLHEIKYIVQTLQITYSDFDIVTWLYGKIFNANKLFGIQNNQLIELDKQEYNDFVNSVNVWIEQNKTTI